jgi:D-inositol-3-phosphate glycosyltransferase
MRILLISDHADPLATPGKGFVGGQNTYVRKLASGLAAAGDAVTVATRWDDVGKPKIQEITPGATVARISAGPVGYLRRDDFLDIVEDFTSGIANLVAMHRYDVIHSHYWFSGVAGLSLAQEYGIPLVHTYHSIGAVRRAALNSRTLDPAQTAYFGRRQEKERAIGTSADAVTASCPAELAEQRSFFGTDAGRQHLIPPGIDTSVMRPLNQEHARMRLGIARDVPIILFVGRLEPRKGVADLLGAMSTIHQRLPLARLVIVGGGDDQPDVDTQKVLAEIDNLGLHDSVDVIGSVPNAHTPYYYNAADVTVVPSHYEPFGLTAIESLACGTPVVASKVGGLQWSIGPSAIGGPVGKVVRPRDAQSIATAVLEVLANGRQFYRASCVERAQRRFSYSAWITAMQNLYQELLTPRDQSTPAATTGTTM